MANMKIRLSRYGESGWEFSITTVDDLTDQPHTARYRTSPQGDGLWQYQQIPANWPDGSPVMEYKQITGTCQFWLPKERKPAYDKIRREFRKR